MFILGVLAIFQACFIPGALFCLGLGVRSILTIICFALPVSMVLNHLLVLLGTFVHIPLSALFGVVLTIETIIGVALFIRSKSRVLCSQLDYHVSNSWNAKTLLAGILFLAGFAKILRETYRYLGTVFTEWDAVVTWNTWAIGWANGQAPISTSLYPQLLPTIYALPYIFIGGAEIEFFSKAIALIFPLYGIFVCLAIAVLFEKFRAIALLTGFFYWKVLDLLLAGVAFSGYADGPLSSCFFPLLLSLLIIEKEANHNERVFSILAGFCLAAAILTKQGGALYILLPPVILGLNDSRKRLFPIYSIAVVLAFPWMVYQFSQVLGGFDSANTLALSKMGGDVGFEKILGALMRFPYYWLLLGSGIINIIFIREARLLSLFCIIIYPIIWASTFSYDFRNLAPVMGGMALGLAYTFGLIFKWLDRPIRSGWKPTNIKFPQFFTRTYIAITLVFGFFSLVWANHWFPEKTLRSNNFTQKKLIGIPEINAALYSEFSTQPKENIKAVSAYGFFTALPEIGEQHNYIVCWKLQDILKLIELKQANYFLAFMCKDEITDYFHALVESNRAKVVFNIEGVVYGGQDTILFKLEPPTAR